MTGHEAAPLARQLRRHGMGLERFVYSSLREEPLRVATRLAARLAAEPDLNLIGHSLGAVIVMLALAEVREWHGRAVLLGPPLAGSDTARRAVQLPGGRFLLGAGGSFLATPRMPQRTTRQVMVIAGVRNIGIGRLLGACARPGDGQVRLAETRLPGAAHRLVRRGHVALLFDRGVAQVCVTFIREGRAIAPRRARASSVRREGKAPPAD